MILEPHFEVEMYMPSLACINCKKFITLDYSDNDSVESGVVFRGEHKEHTLFLTNERDLEDYEESFVFSSDEGQVSEGFIY